MKQGYKKQQGFTLTELLIAIVIAILITLTILSSFILNQRVLRKSNTKSELTQNARIVIDLMSREIRQADMLVTLLPADDSDPIAVAHELQFEDGHINTHTQYIRYYLSDNLLKRQVIVYYFASDPSTYVAWDDVDSFGDPTEAVLEDRTVGENFNQIDFFGSDNVNIELELEKSGETVEMKTIINPRNS